MGFKLLELNYRNNSNEAGNIIINNAIQSEMLFSK